LPAHDKKWNNKASKSDLTVATALSTLLLLSMIAAIGPIESQPAWAGTFPGVNGKIAFVSDRDGNNEIYVMNADGSEQTRLTDNLGDDSAPSWSSDGTKIVFVRGVENDPGEIYVMNADGSEQTRLTNSPGFDSEPSWSPDGSKIAFMSDRDSIPLSVPPAGVEIYVMNADGSEQTRLTNARYNVSPEWSPDGNKIVFTSVIASTFQGNPIGLFEIFVMNADGSEQTQLTNTAFNGDPTWSPDGTKIVFKGDGISIMNADGSEQTMLTDNQIDYSEPSWSPDGTRIAFQASLPDNSVVPFNPNRQHTQIFVMNADGSEQTQLTNNSASDTTPAWGPETMTPEPSTEQPTLTINSADLSGNTISGVWTVIRNATNGTLVQTGFTPLAFIGDPGAEYKVAVANYDGRIFHHWQEDDSTNIGRTVRLTTNETITATFELGDSLRGFTSLAYTGTEEQPDLTVNATSIDGSKVLHMWTIIDPQTTNSSGTSYKVYASNYKDRLFDHWDDGSKDRIRTLTIGEATKITAYYRTG
jgi:Tol biopolymer transport system component